MKYKQIDYPVWVWDWCRWIMVRLVKV